MGQREWRQTHIERRFPPRAHLTVAQLREQCFPDLPLEDIAEAVTVFEREFALSTGFLRPDDSLTALLAPVPAANPWRWITYRGYEGDGVAQIGLELAQRRDAHGWPEIKAGQLRTWGDFIRAWCGK